MSPAIGTSPPRKEDMRLLTGRGRFVSDLQLAGTLHVAFVRSPFAHATIASVDTGAASAAPGVATVAAGAAGDFAGVALRAESALDSYIATEQPILAATKVRFAGEAVAAVVARDRYLAEDVSELVTVEYAPLPVCVRTSDPVVEAVHAGAPDNVLLRRTFSAGDPAGALASAEVVVRRELVTNRHAGSPIEGRCGVALWEPADRRLTLWSGTQVPHLLRNALAPLLDLPEGRIRVVAPDVGGGFGTKSVVYPEDVALCLLARRLPGRPVKWVEDRIEHLSAATHAREHRYSLSAGFAPDATLLALDVDIDCNVGAYSVYPWTAGIEPLMAGGLLTGPYRLENYRCTVRGIATNTAPAGPYRGVARPATVFVMESILDFGARELGVDPIEVRRRNLISPQDVPYRMPARLVDDSGRYEACLDRAVEAIDYGAVRSEQARRRSAGEAPIGVGVACYNELTGLGRAASAGPRMPFRTGHEACTVRVDPDGTVTVLSGVSSQGQGLQTTIAQVVADSLGVGFEDVDVRLGDTGESLWGFGAFSSRQAVIGGGAAHRSARVVRDKVIALSAALLEASEADLDLRGGQVYVAGMPEPVLSLSEVARVAYLESNRLPDGFDPGLQATEFYDPVRGAFAAGAQLAVVEVDPDTGALRILRWVCVEDAGRVINPAVVEGQISGAIAQGIGGALYEHLVYDDAGNLTTSTFVDYLLPTSMEIPRIEIEHLEFPADNPLGVRGVGEGGTLGPYAVLASAVSDALGIEVLHLPITHDVLQASAS
ncbi:MAG: xanthine dehydrogenase family protein molybdopterin-binding subunit [Acidimicrobiales bacterium]